MLKSLSSNEQVLQAFPYSLPFISKKTKRKVDAFPLLEIGKWPF